MLRRDDGFTLIELIVVIAIMAILLLIAVGFHAQARERAGDVTAKSNIRVAVPAIETYRSDQGTYAGMTVAALRASYSAGVQGIDILAADATGYCVRAVEAGRTWYLQGPGGDLTTTACA